jgi:eukaryotic-like serine/threonine-protein kinase
MTQTIGQYELRELLGEGGIGQVHAAYDTVLQREVAMKSLRPELLSDTNFADRFRAEATSLARLNHPNITTLYSLIPDGKNLYMVMERVRGHTLDDILEKRKAPLAVSESLAIISQAADGLAYAHSMGVIHRDIKPSNLMIAENGVLKIMDFGIARVRGSQRLTRTGSIVGTLAYMAPEQLRGEEGDEACDIYSLAIVLYELLTGAPPFSANSEYDLMQAQINEKPARLISRVPGLDSKVEAAIMRALAKKPNQRFASARAFSDALGASALRLDAPKILHNDTRLIETPVDPIQIAPPRRSVVEKLPNIPGLSPELRAVVYGGGIAALLAAGGFGVLMYRSTASPPRAATFQTASVPPPTTTVSLPPLPKLQPPPAVVAPRPSAADTAGLPGPLADIAAAANRGDPAAQNQLGVKYAQGEDGLPRDEVKAVEWYRKAANQNFAKAEVNLGDMYYYGRGGLLQSYLDALSWYLKAAQQDAPDAQYRLGYMYERGTGTLKDTAKAVQLFRSAADHGYADAQNLMGTLYARGDDGLTQDDKQALDWFQKAAAQGNAKAEKNLGDMYFFGHGVDKDYKQAMDWYNKAADQKLADAQFRLGFMYEKGLGVDQNNQLAIDQYTKAVRNGSVDAQRALDRLASVR